MAVTGTARALGAVSKQKLVAANVGTWPNYCLGLFSCLLLSGNSFSEDKADVSNSVGGCENSKSCSKVTEVSL